MAFDSTLASAAFLAGRTLFALVLGYMALGNLLDLGATVGYARSKGVPLAGLAVPAGSLVLVAGSLSVLTGVFPALGLLAVVGFLVAVTPVMHDFWSMDGRERQTEQFHFLKNVGLLGGALFMLSMAPAEWPYVVASVL